MQNITITRGPWRQLRHLCSNQGCSAHQSYNVPPCDASNHAQDHRDGTRARESGNILHYLVRADGAGSGPGQQLAGLVVAAPALSGRPVILIWRLGALAIVLERVVGQECLIPLQNHSVTRALCFES